MTALHLTGAYTMPAFAAGIPARAKGESVTMNLDPRGGS